MDYFILLYNLSTHIIFKIYVFSDVNPLGLLDGEGQATFVVTLTVVPGESEPKRNAVDRSEQKTFLFVQVLLASYCLQLYAELQFMFCLQRSKVRLHICKLANFHYLN